MALPSIVTPEYNTIIPSTEQKITYRPFLVKQEKILLTAQESDDPNDQTLALANVLAECITTADISVGGLTTFDIEYLFLKIRSKSVGENITVKLGHQGTNSPSGTLENKCEYKTEIYINIDEIAPPEIITDKKIQLTDDVGVVIKYPTFQDVINNESSKEGTESIAFMFDMIANSIDYVYDEENVYNEFSDEEMKNWIESLNQSQFEKISNFFNTMPSLKHEVKWKCSKCGEEDTLLIEGLQNFFT